MPARIEPASTSQSPQPTDNVKTSSENWSENSLDVELMSTMSIVATSRVRSANGNGTQRTTRATLAGVNTPA